jgi:Rho guanine nucleotide exchange factor 10
MPLFVKSLPVYRSHHETEVIYFLNNCIVFECFLMVIFVFTLKVRCGCFYTILVRKSGPSVRCLGPRLQNYLWVVTSDGISSHVTLLTSQQPVGPSLKEAGAFSLVEVKVTSVEFSPGTQILYDNESTDQIRGDLVWLGTESRRYYNIFSFSASFKYSCVIDYYFRILLYSAHEPSKTGQVGSLNLPAPVVQLRYHWDQMFVALANGIVAIFKRNSIEGGWELNAPATLVSMGDEPVVSLLPIGSALYAACGRSVFVLDGITGEILVPTLSFRNCQTFSPNQFSFFLSM